MSIRVPEADLAEIDRRAGVRGLTRTAFVLGTALADNLEHTVDERHQRDVEARLRRLEVVTFELG